jgi:outer membrane lipoprotein-sorting protein
MGPGYSPTIFMHINALRQSTVLPVLSLLIGLLGLGFPSFAQLNDPAAEELLSKVSQKYRAYKSFRVSFSRTVEEAGGDKVKNLDMKGEVTVSGNKFNLRTGDQVIYCNGTTLWTHITSSKEVNVADYEPSSDEISPGEIFMLYQKGYRYIMMGEVKNGKETLQIVDLQPDDKTKEFFKIRIYLDKTTLAMRRWIVFERGSNNQQIFSVSSFTPNVPLEPALFAFDKAKHPGVKVIDLR